MADSVRRRAADEVASMDAAPRDAVTPKPPSGAALLAALEAEGLIGLWRDRADITDSANYAKQLRAAAEVR